MLLYRYTKDTLVSEHNSLDYILSQFSEQLCVTYLQKKEIMLNFTIRRCFQTRFCMWHSDKGKKKRRRIRLIVWGLEDWSKWKWWIGLQKTAFVREQNYYYYLITETVWWELLSFQVFMLENSSWAETQNSLLKRKIRQQTLRMIQSLSFAVKPGRLERLVSSLVDCVE